MPEIPRLNGVIRALEQGTTAFRASSTVLTCGKMMPNTPRSSTCLAIHWFISPPLGGTRTSGVTRGASEPDSRICRRSSMYWRASRSPVAVSGACSISKAMPS